MASRTFTISCGISRSVVETRSPLGVELERVLRGVKRKEMTP